MSQYVEDDYWDVDYVEGDEGVAPVAVYADIPSGAEPADRASRSPSLSTNRRRN